MSKIFAVFVKNNPNKVGIGLQNMAFQYGFVWKDSGLPSVKNMPENPFYIQYDLENHTIEFFPFFSRPSDVKIFAIKTEYVSEDIKFPNHPTISLLKKILGVHGRDMTELMEKRKENEPVKLKPNPRAPVWIKSKGDYNSGTHDPLSLMQDFVRSEKK